MNEYCEVCKRTRIKSKTPSNRENVNKTYGRELISIHFIAFYHYFHLDHVDGTSEWRTRNKVNVIQCLCVSFDHFIILIKKKIKQKQCRTNRMKWSTQCFRSVCRQLDSHRHNCEHHSSCSHFSLTRRQFATIINCITTTLSHRLLRFNIFKWNGKVTKIMLKTKRWALMNKNESRNSIYHLALCVYHYFHCYYSSLYALYLSPVHFEDGQIFIDFVVGEKFVNENSLVRRICVGFAYCFIADNFPVPLGFSYRNILCTIAQRQQ